MSLSDSIFIFVLALIIFGPKKLPEIAKQLGRLVGEFRRASNEFKFQIEEELRQSERADHPKSSPAEPTIQPPPELSPSEPSPSESSPSEELMATPVVAATLADPIEPPVPAPLTVVPAAGAEPRQTFPGVPEALAVNPSTSNSPAEVESTRG
jgi:sec-independent protein translocase protein TatB